MWLHDKFSDAENLLKYNPNWVLYTISERYAYFTLLPKPISEYNVKNAPFIFVKLFTDARQLARMPIKDFCTFACHSLAPIKGKVVFFTNCPRSGSTLITQMVQVGQQVVTIAEPMTFTNLAAMYLNTNFPKLGKWLFGYQYEKCTTDKVKPQGLLESTMVIFGAPYSFFLKNRHYYALPEVTYENLVSKPEDTLSAVFDVCGISKLLISEAVTALNRDSQAGTILSRDKMAQVKNLELTTLDRKKLNELVKKMELPESVFHF
ncbi:unnamed protein product [Rotaria sordida]|uniref:Sulfotransferase n=1 Tax=Rotaria sordida TaxID=392033 RepID=A0A815MLM5_9BILA|nr:unnamed protein product [Rotaria sordida]CAF1421318.1 unnamed protein product [Rotaria sordida]